jgi:hypothetical protein
LRPPALLIHFLIYPISSLAVLALASQPAAAQTNVTAPITNRAGHALGSFSGTLNDLQLVLDGDQLVAQGLLSGSLRNRAGNVLRTLTDVPVSLPVNLDASRGEL